MRYRQVFSPRQVLQGLFFSLFLFAASCIPQRPFERGSFNSIRVVLDNNYPPFVFENAEGQLQGILIDEWRLWEQKTGIAVQIEGLDWGKALERMAAGEYDVIDTIFYNPERAQFLDFSAPYADIEVPIYFRSNISGIRTAADLKGFTVAVKAGDNAIRYLQGEGIYQLVEYPSYEAIIQAAQRHEVVVFVMDQPPAEYFLAKYGLYNNFRSSPPMYVGQFHRAVKKGNTALLATIEEGFSLITAAEYRRIRTRWYGQLPLHPDLQRSLIIGSASLIALLLMLGLWNATLRRQVLRRTAELQALFAAMPDAVIVFDRQGRYLEVPSARPNLLVAEPQRLVGKKLEDFLKPETAALHYQAIQRALKEQKTQWIEYELLLPEGKKWFSAALSPLDQHRVMLVARDLSGYKEKEKALQESEAELRQANRLLRILTLCNQALVRARDESQLLKETCEILASVGGYPLVWIGAVDASSAGLKPLAVEGEHKDLLPGSMRPAYFKDPRTQPAGLEPHSLPSAREGVEENAKASGKSPGSERTYLVFPLMSESEIFGSLFVYGREGESFQPEEIELLRELADDLSYGIFTLRQRERQRQTEAELAQANLNLVMAYEATIQGWARALEFHEQETAGHSYRVVELMLRFARHLGFKEEELQPLRYGALLHDIGKMVIPSSVINKPGPLDEQEWTIMRRHPLIAYELLKDIDYLKGALDIPYLHHEWWDGSGYPLGISGENIPLAARMFALVDVFDALTSDRPYRPAYSLEEAIAIIRSLAGLQFDPYLTEKFLELIQQEVRAEGTGSE
ncbi:MAG: transporter substrate-binding domain-containing protein [Anaerolineales bacterium]|nr:transporter substrate-binding domain-containing protein [Anaerolineales bacterium]MDW8162497.1 transporter substrate-binding domain-containing protein [Anaerolineales bacterium]